MKHNVRKPVTLLGLFLACGGLLFSFLIVILLTEIMGTSQMYLEGLAIIILVLTPFSIIIGIILLNRESRNERLKLQNELIEKTNKWKDEGYDVSALEKMLEEVNE